MPRLRLSASSAMRDAHSVLCLCNRGYTEMPVQARVETMAILLTQHDFDRLAEILSQSQDWRLPADRVAFLDAVFAGSSRRPNILARIDLSGRPRATAVSVITFLKDFGRGPRL